MFPSSRILTPLGKRSRSGQASAEFGVVAAVFLTLVFGIMNFARAVYAYNFVSYASREASRYASVHGRYSNTPAQASDISNFVLNETHGLDPNFLTVSTSWSPDNNQGSTVIVQVKYNFTLSSPWLTSTVLPLSSTSQAVIWQ